MEHIENAERQKNEPLTPELLAEVIFASYFYSQGNVNLQRRLLEYVALKRPGKRCQVSFLQKTA